MTADATAETTYPDATMRYGSVGSQVADVFEPEDAVDSLVILLHGGFWRDSDRTRTWAAGRAISEAGHLTATMQYRKGPGSWQAAFDDVVTAIEQLQLSGREFTLHNEAPRRLTLVGHSSGGQLALWAASHASLPTGSRWRTTSPMVTGVLALAPAADLTRMSELGVGEGAVEEFLGGTPVEAPDAYAAADPARLLPSVPVEVLHGAADTVIPPALSEAYAARLAEQGVTDCRLEVVDGVDHTSWGDPSSAAWPAVLAALGRLTS